MSTDLDQAPPRDVVDPFTGELITRSDPVACAKLVRKIRDFEHDFSRLKKWATDAFAEFADERAEWTHHVAGMTIRIDPPTASDIDWDYDELHKLEALLPPERYGELVKQTVVEKANTLKLQNAAKVGGEVGAIIDRAQRRRPKNRSLKFS